MKVYVLYSEYFYPDGPNEVNLQGTFSDLKILQKFVADQWPNFEKLDEDYWEDKKFWRSTMRVATFELDKDPLNEWKYEENGDS